MMLHNEKHWSQRDDKDIAKSRLVNRWRDKAWWNDYERERRLFGRWLCKEAENGNRQWSPMRYVSQQEIDEWREWKCQRDGVRKLESYDKYPHAITRDRSYSYKWSTIWGAGYYRVEHRSKPSDPWEEYNTGGFPEHHANGVVKDFEKYRFPEFIDMFLNHFVDKELELMEKESKEREERSDRLARELEEKQRIRNKEIDAYERYSRTRGVTPDVETTAFFQALATGSLIK